MSVDLEAQLTAVASYLDRSATPVSLDEMSPERCRDEDWSALERGVPPSVDLDSQANSEQVTNRRRTRVLAFAGVLATAAALAGLLAITTRDTSETPVQPLETPAPTVSTPTSPTAAPVDTTPITTAPIVTEAPVPPPSSQTASSLPDVAPTSTDSVTNSSVVESDATAAHLADVAAAVATAQSTFDSFAATATVRRGTTPAGGGDVTYEPDMITAFVLRNDGSLWSSGGSLFWSAYDASTGIARNQSVDQSGVPRYQQVVGWGDNTVPLGVGVGFNPVFDLNATLGAASVEDVDEGERSAWRIAFEPQAQASDFSSSEVYVVDKATGLVLRHLQTQTESGAVSVFEQVLSDLELGAALPPEFPGVFPLGATVDMSGDPNGFQRLDLAGAIAQFGPHMVLPEGLSGTARFRVETLSLSGEDGQPASNWVTLHIDIPAGFSKTQIIIKTEVPIEGAPLRAGTILIDGLICASADGVTCLSTGDTSLIVGGDLAGQPAIVDANGVYIEDGPRSIFISAPTRDVWEAMANSLERVSG